MLPAATWRSGYAAACKAVYTGSIPVVASELIPGLSLVFIPLVYFRPVWGS
jgi:hypothetical protein